MADTNNQTDAQTNAQAEDLYDAVIVGGGPAGLTAAIYLARAQYRVIVVEKEKFGGQITITEEVVNYPGVAKTSGAALAETMRQQAESFGAEFMLAEVTKLDVSGDIKTVTTSRGDLHAFGILLATGAHPRHVGFPGEEEFQGRGVAYCATCDGEFFTGKEVFVVGGGFAAAEESVFLTTYASHVTVLIRKDGFSCAQSAADECLNNPKITVLTNTEIVEAIGDTALRTLRYRNNKTGEESEYSAPEGDTFGIFVLAGRVPATALLEGIADVNDAGYVITDEHQQTTATGLYAAGDVCTKSLRQVVTATGEAALAATELERYAASLREKTGIIPQNPKAQAADAQTNEAEGATCKIEPDGSAVCSIDTADTQAATDGTTDADSGTGYLDPEMKPQLDAVFERMEAPLVLELHLDDQPISNELRGWMEELADYTDRLSVTVAANEPSEETPYVRVMRTDEDGNLSDSGVGFHGVPGGHEFTSFVLGLYNVAGPGQPIDDETQARIEAIDKPIDLKILVSLSCTNCPDLVVATQHIAADSPNVRAHAYDINHFPELKERFNVMSVPCLVMNDEVAGFGKKGIAQVLDIIAP